MIEGIQGMISVNNNNSQGPEEDGATTGKEPAIEIGLAMKKHWEAEIKILREAPRDAEKLREILTIKQKEYEKATSREDIERLVSEIEMLKIVLFLVCRNEDTKER